MQRAVINYSGNQSDESLEKGILYHPNMNSLELLMRRLYFHGGSVVSEDHQLHDFYSTRDGNMAEVVRSLSIDGRSHLDRARIIDPIKLIRFSSKSEDEKFDALENIARTFGIPFDHKFVIVEKEEGL